MTTTVLSSSLSLSAAASNNRRRCERLLRLRRLRLRRGIIQIAKGASARATTSGVPRGDTAGAVMSIKNIRLSRGADDLLSMTSLDQTIRVEPGDCCGLIGPNGCGKSSLLRAIGGLMEHDSGDCVIAQNVELGYLEQTGTSGSTLTIYDEATSKMETLNRLKAKMFGENAFTSAAEEAEARAEWERVDGDNAEKRISGVLSGLGFDKNTWATQSCASLSGGWQMRVSLAKLLLSEAGECEKTGVNGGFLLLDEPTNHLDSNAKKWLQSWIKKYKGTILLVSHDEEVLREVCTRIVEVKNKKLVSYPGSYAQYLRAKAAKAKEAQKILERTGRETKKLETFINTYGAKATKAKQAKDKEKKLEKALEILKDAQIDAETAGAMNVDEAEEMNSNSGSSSNSSKNNNISLRLADPPNTTRMYIQTKGLCVGYEGKDEPIATDATFEIERESRILICGRNGAGKSTLLKTLAKVIPPKSGELRVSEDCELGYFDQDLAQKLPLDKTGLEYVLDVARVGSGIGSKKATITDQMARSALGSLGITGTAAIDRTIGELSGGEKARVALAGFMLKPVDCLLLDEPTNHLDINSIDAITSALRDWKGGVICVTHNPRFASRLKPTTVVRCRGGEDMREGDTRAIDVELWPEGKMITASDLYARDCEVEECSLDDNDDGNDEAAQAAARAKELEAADRKAKEKRRKEVANAPKIIDKIERAMAVLDEDIQALSEKTLACGSDVGEAMKLQKQIDEKTEKRDAYFQEWERLEELLMEVEEEEEEAKKRTAAVAAAE